MGTDDIFKKRRAARKQRKHEYRKPKANSFLIVTEGKRTEPLYFKGMQQLIKEKTGGNIEVVEAPVIEIRGEGCGTGKLIEITDRLVKEARIIYQNVWVVFDKDDFRDFDQAISTGEEKGNKIAWSNQSFEYWLYLHFCYSDSALHRDEWRAKLDEIFRKYKIGGGKYRKNDTHIYQLVKDGVDTAIANAEKQMAGYEKSGKKPSEYDPGTTVYKLVKELKRYLEEE